MTSDPRQKKCIAPPSLRESFGLRCSDFGFKAADAFTCIRRILIETIREIVRR